MEIKTTMLAMVAMPGKKNTKEVGMYYRKMLKVD
jgi:hypothetical protein